MTVQPSDSQVVAQVLRGDREAYGVLVARYHREFAAYAYRLLGSEADAADVVQDGFVRAYRHLGQCREPARFKAWLFRIVRNQAHSRLAALDRTRAVSLDRVAALAGRDDPVEALEQEDEGARVRAAVRALPPDQHEAVLLHYVQGCSVAEIADLLRLSVPAVKMRLLRARAVLREKLEDLFHERRTSPTEPLSRRREPR